MYKQLSGWWQAKSFEPVTAKVLKAELVSHSGETTTYRTEALFSYEYMGHQHLSSNVNLSGSSRDNIGSYQQDTYQQLLSAKNNATPVTVWVNPRQQDQAVYDRTLRWTMIIFLIPFAVLFPAVGLGAWWMIWRIWRNNENLDLYAIALGAGKSRVSHAGPITLQGDGGGLTVLLVFSGFWNLISWPIATLAFISQMTPWWALLLVAIFPAAGLVLLIKALKIMREQWRIGKPVLVLTQPGNPGQFPLQGEVYFNPALGTRLDASQATHAVSVYVEYLNEDRRGESISQNTLWRGQALHARVARGTHSVQFKIDLPENLPASQTPSSRRIRNYWQVVLKTLGTEVKYILPEQAVSRMGSAGIDDLIAPSSDMVNDRVSGIASRIRWGVQALIFVGIAYFIWGIAEDFVIPLYHSRHDNTAPASGSPAADSQQERSRLPKINVPFLLDSLSGNGFGVVARAIGKMEIGDNTVRILPEYVVLRSYSNCSSDCPVIRHVKFSLSRAGTQSFSILSQSASIPVEQQLRGILDLPVNIPAQLPPVILSFKDRSELATLRLTLEIEGELTTRDKPNQASWYTHAEPFAAALGLAPARQEVSDQPGQRQTQAQQAVLEGRDTDLSVLLKAGVDPDAPDADGQTMLMRAANRGDVNSVKLLLAHGAKVNATTAIDKDGNGSLTALHAALRLDAVDVVKILIEAGANPQIKSNQVWTPMHYAAYRGALKSIRYLHGKGVKIDEPFTGARKSTPLMIAAEHEQVTVIHALLELGADPHRKDLYGEDACGYARFFNKPASKKALGCT